MELGSREGGLSAVWMMMAKNDTVGLPPGTGPTRDYSGPWFKTSLLISSSLGIFSILVFELLRRRWRRVYMGRALLKSKEASDPSTDYPGFLGWVRPVLRVSDTAIVRTVGLDAVVLLDFMKTSFYFFTICAIAAILVLMPVNLTRNGSTDDDVPDPDNGTSPSDPNSSYIFRKHPLPIIDTRDNTTVPVPRPNPTLMDLIIDPQTTIGLHLLFVYFFSILALYLLHKNFHRFLARRRIFALARKNSVPARTVLVSAIPPQLRDEQQLRDYFEKDCGWKVESIRMVKNVGRELRLAIQEREAAMRGLERVWWQYRGGKGLGSIRLPDEEEDERGEEEAIERREEHDPVLTENGDGNVNGNVDNGVSRSSSRNGRLRSNQDVGLSLGEEPNWGEVRREHALPSTSVPPPFVASTDLENGDTPSGAASPGGNPANRERPSTRVPKSTLQKAIPLLGEKVDAIDYWQDKFDAADAKVRTLRKRHGADKGGRDGSPDSRSIAAEEGEGAVDEHGVDMADRSSLLNGHTEWKTTEEGFVTFENIRDAEFAAQVVHFPEHSECRTTLAPDPDDIIWKNMGMANREHVIRTVLCYGVMIGALLFWAAPVSVLASLLSFEEIKKVAPWLARLIEENPIIGSLIQTTLPSTAILIFNAALPYLLEILCYFQGFRSKSEVATSILKKYTIFLLVTVLFVFLVVSTLAALLWELANSPDKIPRKLAAALGKSNTRAYSTSYVMLSGLGIMPFQLLNFGSLFFIALYRTLFRLTPREHVELYAPPAINYGMIYPPAIMVFILTLIYSVISPLILIFGAIYFGMGYLVYKYKLIYVFVNPYESTGDAWPTTFARLVWGVVLLQVFMTGLFAARGSVIASTGMIPLLLGTVAWSWTMREDFKGLSQHTPLASIAQADHAEADDDHPVSIRYGRLKGSAVYAQYELSETLPTPWIMK